ncbi:unnamed protein product [Closterium sp. NIES-54]
MKLDRISCHVISVHASSHLDSRNPCRVLADADGAEASLVVLLDSHPKPAAARSRPLPLTSLNHVSIHCSNVEQSVNFYCDVMGFVPVRRPDCLNFDGAWLFNHGIGIHLLGQSEDPHAPQLRVPKEINPKSDHFSFQCDHIEEVESGLEERGIPFLRQCVEEAGIMVEQLFFHDPDGHMIEVCNCDLLPVVPLRPDPDMPLALPACVRHSASFL